MVAKGLSISTALVLLITFSVIIPNYGTGTIQTMLSVEQSHCILSPKVAKLKLSLDLRESCNDPHQTSSTDSNQAPKSFPYHPSGSTQVKATFQPFPNTFETNKGKKQLLGSGAGASTLEEHS